VERVFLLNLEPPKSELRILESLCYKIGQDPEWEAYIIRVLLWTAVFLNHSEMAEQLKDDEIFLCQEIADKSWSHNWRNRKVEIPISGLNLLMFLIMSYSIDIYSLYI